MLDQLDTKNMTIFGSLIKLEVQLYIIGPAVVRSAVRCWIYCSDRRLPLSFSAEAAVYCGLQAHRMLHLSELHGS